MPHPVYAACAVSPPSLCPSAGIYNHPHFAEECATHSGTKLVSRGKREKALDHRTTLVQLHRKYCGDHIAATWNLELETLKWSLHSPRRAHAKPHHGSWAQKHEKGSNPADCNKSARNQVTYSSNPTCVHEAGWAMVGQKLYGTQVLRIFLSVQRTQLS